MTKLDLFESTFRSADKPVFNYQRIEFERLLLVTDYPSADAEALSAQVRRFLAVLDGEATRWEHLGGDGFRSVQELLDAVGERRPDLVVTYRHLHSNAWQWPHSLGEYLDVLTQATELPIIVLPHPDADRALRHSLDDTDRVMAITDHLTGDDRLVNHALRFTQAGGCCWLTHVESAATFERYVDLISKIPGLETDDARDAIEAQLLKEPRDYIATCRRVIEAESLPISLDEIVAMGRRLDEYRRLIREKQVDLLVMNTMDGDQLAMKGSAYPLAVGLRSIPLLML
jgi:hypothetical protein